MIGGFAVLHFHDRNGWRKTNIIQHESLLASSVSPGEICVRSTEEGYRSISTKGQKIVVHYRSDYPCFLQLYKVDLTVRATLCE